MAKTKLKTGDQLKKHLIVSDFHIPDHNVSAVKLLYLFIADFKPDYVHILGDFVNFTKISKYDQDPYYEVSLDEEIYEAQNVLSELAGRSKKANRECEIRYSEGNHEQRITKFLARNAQQLAKLSDSGGEKIVSLPHLFEFKRLGIRYYPADTYYRVGNSLLLHGDRVRSKSGYTANAMIDKFGVSGFSGHTHRLSHVTRTQLDTTHFWIETGCFCNLKPTPTYTNNPDWCNGFAVMYTKGNEVYPSIVQINNNKFNFGGKIYE